MDLFLPVFEDFPPKKIAPAIFFDLITRIASITFILRNVFPENLFKDTFDGGGIF